MDCAGGKAKSVTLQWETGLQGLLCCSVTFDNLPIKIGKLSIVPHLTSTASNLTQIDSPLKEIANSSLLTLTFNL